MAYFMVGIYRNSIHAQTIVTNEHILLRILEEASVLSDFVFNGVVRGQSERRLLLLLYALQLFPSTPDQNLRYFYKNLT
jgi:hypothetical protein